MAHTILEFENKALENHKRYMDAPVGFSWTALFFPGYVCLYRKQILLFIVYTIIYYILLLYIAVPVAALIATWFKMYTDSVYLIGLGITFVVTRLIVASLFNRFYVYLLKQDGFKLINVRSAMKGQKPVKNMAYYKAKYNL